MAITAVRQLMGLPISVDLRDGTQREADMVFDWLHEVDLRFSPFRLDSEVTRLDEGRIGAEEISADLLHVLALCETYELRSGGAFKAKLPGRQLDPNAVVKGWAVQRAADLLRAAGLRRFCINAGGDVVTAGEPTDGEPWRVGIRHPDDSQRVCAVVGIRDGAVATSAAYERGNHIIDGRTGLPAFGLLSMTVYAPDLTTADATATAAFAMGIDGPEWAAQQPGCLVHAVDSNHRVFRSPELPVLS
ncbi:FAD:protein FMN transferase [Kibdelosporangium persicum]|uniref:FAD:protein FMN transferase n=1 Tax=Kibdelosporangium persicum TaxID=2698649 RepID=A0ABX2F6B1_9PSEU|nr:FAD:protein FMN transferase [Kibdelosporangium persicum]NRN66723.1 FAD:protein FMN transferase [Kibdelosporangium persicum]